MRTVEEASDEIDEVIFCRCDTFFEDMLRSVQYALLWCQSWCPHRPRCARVLEAISWWVGGVRCRIYGHHYLIDRQESILACVCCGKVQEFG